MSRAIFDTSVFVAREAGRPILKTLPDEIAYSVVSLAELELGVLVAVEPTTRAQRLRTVTGLRALGTALPIDEDTASAYALLAATVLAAGRKPRVNDTWIAATALVHGAAVWTQDADFSDFGDIVEIVSV